MMRRTRAGVTLALIACLVGFTGCGGTDAEDAVERPEVRGFSPQVSPIDFQTNQQNPTFTDNGLTVSVDGQYQGKVVVYFRPDTVIDPASVFLGGNPFLGLDPSALQLTQEIPGVGNVQVPVQVTVAVDRVILQPLPPYATPNGGGFTTNMPDGQYTIGVFQNIRNTDGDPLTDGPVFHSYVVGQADTIPPRVITTSPGNGASNVGAGLLPPEPPGNPEDVASITVDIFGPPTPDVVIRFTEGVRASSVNANNISVVDAGAQVQPPPLLTPAPGFPKLKSDDDGATLPSNGHEVIWRIDQDNTAGFPFGTQIEVTVVGSDPDGMGVPANASPIVDLAGNPMENTFKAQFQTVAPPSLPSNPQPEYAIWWSASNRVGVLDPLNIKDLAAQFLGTAFPQGIRPHVLVDGSDTISTDQNIPNFDPFEIVFDSRTNGANCHSWIYVQSEQSGQVAIIHTRDSLPVGLLSTPTPGGISANTSYNAGERVLVVTNTGANTLTAFGVGGATAGGRTVNAPIFITNVQPTGNNPQPVAITGPPSAAPSETIPIVNRHNGFTGPFTSLIMYGTQTDGVVATTTLVQEEGPVREFALGAEADPNDICLSPCFQPFGPTQPFFVIGTISLGGLPNEGSVAMYISNPGCLTGQQSTFDSIIGQEPGLDGPSGLVELVSATAVAGQAWFAVAETGANRITMLSLQGGQPIQTGRLTTGVGLNPSSLARRASWNPPCITNIGTNPLVCGGPSAAGCTYYGTEMWQFNPGPDGTGDASNDFFICARGQSQVTVVDGTSGARPFDPPPQIPGVRYVASEASQ